MLVKPLHMRLITAPRYPYNWLYLLEEQHLFEENMDEHFIGAYMESCCDVGVSFEAEPAGTSTYHMKQGDTASFRPYTSFQCRNSHTATTNVPIF